jgi:hypothetical protein
MNRVPRPLACVFALLVAGCGGPADEAATPASDTAMRQSSPSPARAAPSSERVAVAASAVANPLALRDWLDRLGRLHRLDVRLDPALADRPVAAPLPAQPSADDIATALAGFDLQLGYARGGPGGSRLAWVNVMLPGGGALPRTTAPAAQPAARPPLDADPAQALLRIQHELASGDPAVRGAALARSFDFEAPLPAPALVAALQSDASGEVRLYALMALARHPAVEPLALRPLAEAAAADADPAVRAHAAEVLDGIDRLGRSD